MPPKALRTRPLIPPLHLANAASQPKRARRRKPAGALDCRVQIEAERFFAHGRSLLATMRRLRQEMQHCPACPQALDCPLLRHFNEQAAQAVAEISDEFNLQEA